jgi:hypothetical protein
MRRRFLKTGAKSRRSVFSNLDPKYMAEKEAPQETAAAASEAPKPCVFVKKANLASRRRKAEEEPKRK